MTLNSGLDQIVFREMNIEAIGSGAGRSLHTAASRNGSSERSASGWAVIDVRVRESMPETHNDRHAAVFFVARLNSSRLPGKVLLPIAGKPLFFHQVDRLLLAELPTRYVMCTSDSPDDDALADAAASIGLDVFRGPELDVPRRLLGAAEHFNIDLFVLAGTDEHYIEPSHVDAIIRHAREHGGDWIHVHGNPIGSWVRGVSRRALRMLCAEMDTNDLDGWGAFFEKDDRFQLGNLQLLDAEDSAFSEGVRLTIDYVEDFALAEALYERLYTPGHPLMLDEVIKTLKENPTLVDINRHRQDHYYERLKSLSAGLIE
jgi:spore coat polysaccharide biosynthesis protein SpsF